MDFVGTSFSASDCVVLWKSQQSVVYYEQTAQFHFVSAYLYTKRCRPFSTSCSFYGSPWEYLQKEMEAVGEADKKYMTCFGHMFT